MYGRIKRIHFVGIGGIGMSGIAEVLLNQGYQVTGSDLRETPTTTRLEGLGAAISIGHNKGNIGSADVVVTSAAVTEDNPEVREAASRGIPVIPRAEMLSELMRLKHGIAIAGSHGKTTTTSLIATVMSSGGFDPTIVVGGRVETLGSNAHLGKGEFMVVEADESDGSFLMLSPAIAVVTNIDEEHMDHYGSLEALKAAFVEFLNKIPFYGLAVVCVDSPNVASILQHVSKRTVTYGFSPTAELRAHDVRVEGFTTRFRVTMGGEELGEITLALPGRHNALNALAAVAVGFDLGMTFEEVSRGIADFRGIERRLQHKGLAGGAIVIDDYGHHPEEIRVTLEALRQSSPSSRLIVVFQPHRYTRTHALLDEFAGALSKTDVLFLLDIYPAGEQPIDGVTSATLKNRVAALGHGDVHHESDTPGLTSRLARMIEPGDIVLTLGAGNVWRVGERLVEELA